jgi:hypothetical protein
MMAGRAFAPAVALFAAALASPGAASAQPAPATVSAAEAFAQLARLAGRWRPADRPESPLRIQFYLTAGGSALVESWERAGQPHSMSVYHRDGPALLATHYCPQGNHPRLALVGRDAKGLHFSFRDATDLDRATESHQHDLWLDVTNPDRLVRGEIYHGTDGPGAYEQIQLVRDSEG